MPFVVNVCVALHRDGRWLLTVRGPDVLHAPNTLGLVGGHLERGPGVDALELTGVREVREETGLDLTGATLSYLDSELFAREDGADVLAVTFVAEVPRGQQPWLAAPDELAAVEWWTLTELEANPHCPPWTLRLISCAEAAVSG